MSSSFANQTIAQIELWTERDSGKYPVNVYTLAKHLDEEGGAPAAPEAERAAHQLTDQQAAYIGVAKQGPYKSDRYRY